MRSEVFCNLALGVALAASLGCVGAGTGGAGAGRPSTPSANAAGVSPAPGRASAAAVPESASRRFTEAAALMRAHDEAAEGRGDWTARSCNEVAERFERAASEVRGGAFAEAWFNRGLAFERCGMTVEARAAMERANAVTPRGYCRARAQLGVYHYRAGQLAESRQAFEQAVRDDPNCVEAYTNLAMLQREALTRDARYLALSAQPPSPERDRDLDELFRDVVSNIRQALARDDRFLPALNQLALAYLARAGDDPRSQRLMLAGVVCAQATQVAAQHRDELAADVRGFVADVYNTWGLVDIRAGQIVRALEHFRRAFQLNPAMFEAWMNYGTINLSFRGYGDAREAFQHAVQLHDTDYDAHVGLGVALRGLGQTAQARAEYQRAVALNATRADAFYDLGVLYDSHMTGSVEELEQAVCHLREFVSRANDPRRYGDAVTRANAHIRNDEDAIRALRPGAPGNGPTVRCEAVRARGTPAGTVFRN